MKNRRSVLNGTPVLFERLLLCERKRLVFQRSLCSSQSRDRYAERRAGYVGQAHSVAELNRGRVAAVLAADSAVEVFSYALTELNSHFHKLAYAYLVELGKRIVLEYLRIIVSVKELTGVIS